MTGRGHTNTALRQAILETEQHPVRGAWTDLREEFGISRIRLLELRRRLRGQCRKCATPSKGEYCPRHKPKYKPRPGRRGSKGYRLPRTSKPMAAFLVSERG